MQPINTEHIKEEKKVPNLRFPGFEGEWENNALGSIAHFSKGKGISKSDIAQNGELECIRYGELYTIYGEVIINIRSRTNLKPENLVLSEKNDVIIPASGETQIDIATASCVLKAEVAIGGDLNIIKSSVNGIFLSYYLNNKKKIDIAKLSQGISVVHLYNSQLKTLKLKTPSSSEQQKIASFLSAVDQKIQQLTRKKELLELYKKGVMQKIFSREIRFRDENGNDFPDWDRVELGEIVDYEQPTKYLVESTEYDDNYYTPVLTAGKTFILGYSDEEYGIFKKDLPVIIFDDFTTAFKFVDFPFKAKSSAMKILKAKSDEVNIKFVYESMTRIRFPFGEHKRYWISEYRYNKIVYPSIDEQKKISDFLNAIDKKVNAVENQLAQTQQFKKGLLQQMFV